MFWKFTKTSLTLLKICINLPKFFYFMVILSLLLTAYIHMK